MFAANIKAQALSPSDLVSASISWKFAYVLIWGS
jgi:hypothetical protein